MNTDYSFVPGEACPYCKKIHKTSVKEMQIKPDVIAELPNLVEKYNGTRAFVIADVNTYPAGGESIVKTLEGAGIPTSKQVFADRELEPDEKAVGSLFMHYDHKCDIIIAFGSGVINDLSKILANFTGKPYIIVASASSMDGYASGTSSVARDGLKVSLNSRCPDVILADPEILKDAPIHMIKSGFGDMIAKYVSICEWRISNLINGEEYCEEIAAYIRSSREACVRAASGILKGDADSAATIFKELVEAGKAMDYAGSSRPASGSEHYFSHLWDMRGLEFGTPTDTHGVQTAIGTIYALKCYEMLKNIVPNREKALKYAAEFDFADWSAKLTEFLGKSAEAMIALEAKERKYDLEKHRARLDIIIDKWDEIIKIIDEELPSSAEVENMLSSIEAPKSIEEIGMDKSILPMTLMATKDIRDKYILSRLLWDLGVLDEVAAELGK